MGAFSWATQLHWQATGLSSEVLPASLLCNSSPQYVHLVQWSTTTKSLQVKRPTSPSSAKHGFVCNIWFFCVHSKGPFVKENGLLWLVLKGPLAKNNGSKTLPYFMALGCSCSLSIALQSTRTLEHVEETKWRASFCTN